MREKGEGLTVTAGEQHVFAKRKSPLCFLLVPALSVSVRAGEEEALSLLESCPQHLECCGLEKPVHLES